MLLKYLKNALVLAVLGITLLGGPAPVHAAGTLPLAMAQQQDINGQPTLCQLTFFVAGTPATPQNAYADFSLTQALPSPLTCDQTGRVPMFWLADGLIHVRMIDGNGLSIVDTTMQVLGPSSGGGGGGGTVDPTTILSTGDLKWRLDKDPIAGWVRINGLTIGTTGSGATERANTDTQSLYVYVWTKFSQPSGNVICPVSGGLGASALADFNAGKQLTLEDARSRGLYALDDMGNSALGGFTGVTFSVGNATTGGSRGGTNSTTVLPTWLPSITSSGVNTINSSGVNTINSSGVNTINSSGNNSISVSSAPSGKTFPANQVMSSMPAAGGAQAVPVGGSAANDVVSTNPSQAISVSASPNIAVTASPNIAVTASPNIAVTSNNTGGVAMPSLPSALLGTLFWKL